MKLKTRSVIIRNFVFASLIMISIAKTKAQCVHEEIDGVVAVEAENFISQSKIEYRQWYMQGENNETPTPDPDGVNSENASGGRYVELLPDTRVTHDDPLVNGQSFCGTAGDKAIISYNVYFNNTGRYYVWVRVYSSGSEDNGIHVGIDNTWPESGQRMQWCEGKNNWTWESKQRTEIIHCGVAKLIYLDVNTVGLHTINFSQREDGFEMDKFVLSKEYTKPVGNGPDVIYKEGGCNFEIPIEKCPIAINATGERVNFAVAGYNPGVVDSENDAVTIDASLYKGECAMAKTIFNSQVGIYDISLNTLAELAGESAYSISINGIKQSKTYTNPVIFGTDNTNYTPASHTWRKVNLSFNDTIMVEFCSTSNGNVSNGDSFEYSNAMWTSIDIKYPEVVADTIDFMGIVEFENYDLNINTPTYYDTDATNNGGTYRKDGVDIEYCAEGGYNLGWTEAGEWLDYTIMIPVSGEFNFEIRSASESAVGVIQFAIDGIDITDEIKLPATGGWQTYETTKIENINLKEGLHKLRLKIIEAGANLNFMNVSNKNIYYNLIGIEENVSYGIEEKMEIKIDAFSVSEEISSIECFLDNNSIGQAANSVLSVNYTSDVTQEGYHDIKIDINDTKGNSYLQTWKIYFGNRSPLLKITPQTNMENVLSTIYEGGNNTLQLTAFDYDGKVESMKLFIDNNLVIDVDTSFSNYDINTLAKGTYKITAEAIDDNKNIGYDTLFINIVDSLIIADDWTLYNKNGADANIKFDADNLTICSNSITELKNDIQLSRAFSMGKDSIYTISFNAFSELENEVEIILLKNSKTTLLSQVSKLSNQAKKYTIVYESKRTVDQANLCFYFGNKETCAQIYDFEINVSPVVNTSISNEAFEENIIAIYPNPTSNTINLSQSCNYELYNIYGAKLFEGKNKSKIDISSLSNNIYILKTDFGIYKILKK